MMTLSQTTATTGACGEAARRWSEKVVKLALMALRVA
jgi:hypothetical protein